MLKTKLNNVVFILLSLTELKEMTGYCKTVKICYSPLGFSYFLSCVVLVEECEENSVSHVCVVGKQKIILIAFSDNCEYSLVHNK